MSHRAHWMHLYDLACSSAWRWLSEFETPNNQEMICNGSFFYSLYKATFKKEEENEQIEKCWNIAEI